MGDPRRLHALDLEATSAGLRVTLLDGAGELGQVEVVRADLDARDAILAALEVHATLDLTSLLVCAGGPEAPRPGAREALRGVALRARLDRWDFVHLVAPWTSILAARACVVLTTSTAAASLHSLRGALRQAVRDGLASRSLLAQVSALPMWHGEGLKALELVGDEVRLPEVIASGIEILVGPPPADVELALEAALAAGVRLEELVEELEDSPQVLLGAVHSGALRRLFRALDERARACGARLIAPATSRDLRRALLRPELGTLVLIAHNDRSGLHLGDGALSWGAFVQLAAEVRAERPGPHRGSIDLCVCGADQTDGLAGLMQSLGIPVVLARRGYALMADCLAGWCEVLEELQRGGSAPLPVLLDRAWVRRGETGGKM